MTMATTSEWLAEGQKLHQAQRFADAETLYRRVIDADANHVVAWYHLGLVCLAQHKLVEAADGFQAVLALTPHDVDALTQLGIVLARQNRLSEAVAKFREAIALKPQYAKAHNNLGVALTQMGQRDEGLACYKEAAALQHDYAEAHFNLGVALAERQQAEEAIAAYEHALRARPDYPDALFNLGMLLVEERRPSDAIVHLEQAVRLLPNNAEAHNNLSLVLADLGRFDDALASCESALRLRPLDAKSHMNRGNVVAALGRMDEALACYAFALRLQPDYTNANWNRSLALLGKGDFQRGWREYESRWKKPESKLRTVSEPLWDVSPLQDKTILLWCEQGIGDTFQFVRYAFEVKKRGATVWLGCQEALVPLLSTCPGVDKVFAEGGPAPQGFDCHAPLMSLPLMCGTTLANVPAETPYLRADAAEVERWRKEFSASPHLKIGVTWQGNPKHRWDRHRSFSVHWFRSLATLEGVEVYSLQKGPGTEELKTVRFPITNLRPRLDELGGTFQNTAAAIQALDLIVTCDSAVAHLAGALGVPVWIPLSALADWRWLRDREDTPWYPTMRLFRQSKLGEWGPVFERMRAEAAALRDARPRSAPATFPPNSSGGDKIVAWPALLESRCKARAAGKKVVWTNGCFDLLHVGHIRNLQTARSQGDLLVVGVNSDASVHRLKGPGRPIVPVAQRAEVLAALGCVDYVIVFDDDTPLEAIRRLEPDIHCKGCDYAPPNGKPIPEAAIIEGYGGRIEFLPMVPSVSTSDLVGRIQNGHPIVAEPEASASALCEVVSEPEA
jgi:rfaE bifunctional protein nucleotidyltransferase chain/domain